MFSSLRWIKTPKHDWESNISCQILCNSLTLDSVHIGASFCRTTIVVGVQAGLPQPYEVFKVLVQSDFFKEVYPRPWAESNNDASENDETKKHMEDLQENLTLCPEQLFLIMKKKKEKNHKTDYHKVKIILKPLAAGTERQNDVKLLKQRPYNVVLCWLGF